MEQENLYQENVAQVESQQEQPEVQQEQPEAQPEQIQQAAQQQDVDDRERNFARLREERARAEYERDEAIRYIQQMQQQQQPQPEPDDNVSPDDLVEAKYVDRKIQKLEKQLRQYEQQTQYQVTEARIKSHLNDFDQVVTKANIDALRSQYPEIAQALHATPDIYNKAVSTYNIIKKFGINQTPQSMHDKTVVAKNAIKPRSTNSISPQMGDSPLNKANDFANGFLSEERKAQLWAETQAARAQS